MAGTIVTDRIESDATYDSKIELVSPVLVSNTFSVKSTGGTGVFNIVGANTNTDRTFTLPDVAGTVVTEVVGNEAYKKQNILGTVSQSGGVPTGAIIERGSNVNGEFVKYADGTMITWIQVSCNMTITTNQNFSGPASFAAGSVVTGAYSSPAGTGTADLLTAMGNCALQAFANGDFIMRFSSTSGQSPNTFNVSLFGRWF